MRIAKACVTAGAALYKEAMEPSLFKLLVLTMLADTTVLLTIGTTIHFQLTGVLIPTAITGTLSSIYLIGCLIAAFEARHFGKRFESKVRNAEIIGLHPVEVERIVSGLDPLDKSQRIVDGFNPNRRRPGLFSRLCGCLWRILCCGRKRGPRVDHYAVEYALFTLCRSRGLVGVFERERREHALRLMPLSRSLPFVRLLRLLSYQPEATPLDFSAALNSTVLYACTLALPTVALAAFSLSPLSDGTLYAVVRDSPMLAPALAGNAIMAILAFFNIIFDIPRAMLKRHATPADGESSRDMTSARGLRATAEYVHRISTAKLLACKHEGRKGPKAEEEILEGMFELKAEQVGCLERQLWTDMQLARAAETVSSRDRTSMPRKRHVVAPKRPPRVPSEMEQAASSASSMLPHAPRLSTMASASKAAAWLETAGAENEAVISTEDVTVDGLDRRTFWPGSARAPQAPSSPVVLEPVEAEPLEGGPSSSSAVAWMAQTWNQSFEKSWNPEPAFMHQTLQPRSLQTRTKSLSSFAAWNKSKTDLAPGPAPTAATVMPPAQRRMTLADDGAQPLAPAPTSTVPAAAPEAASSAPLPAPASLPAPAPARPPTSSRGTPRSQRSQRSQRQESDRFGWLRVLPWMRE